MRTSGVALVLAITAGAAHAQAMPLTQARQVTHSYNLDLVPAPDGKRAVFIRIVEGREQLFLVNLDGSGETRLTSGAFDDEDPAWSPDGRTIAFVRIVANKKAIHLIKPDGSGSEALSTPGQSPIHPSWTPDGKRLLYCTDDDLRPPAKNEAQIYAIDLATRRIATLISGGINTFPVMSPDGRRIAFRKILGEMNSEVFVADADGSNLKNLTNHWSFDGWPAWSPDGRTIAFAGNRNAAYQIFLMDPDGGNVRLLANTEGRGTAPKWAADGRTIYFTLCQQRDFGRACEIMAAKVGSAR